MKVAVSCVSPLLQKSLELFLKEYLASPKQCDILLSDTSNPPVRADAPLVRIGADDDADIKKPFSKSQLFIALENTVQNRTKSEAINDIAAYTEEVASKEGASGDFAILEREIERITKAYQAELIATIKAFYE